MPDESSLPTDARAIAGTPRPRTALLQRAYGGPEVFEIGEVPTPEVGPGEVLLEVVSAGVDRGTWHLMTGRPYLMRLMGFGFGAPKNVVPGLDVAGRVLAVGEGVDRFAPGDEVFGIAKGSFAEVALADASKLARAPRAIPLADAGVLAVSGITAVQALDAAAVVAGDRVLVLGASGGVGTYAVQLAKHLGASVVAAASASKLDLLRALGADEVVDYRTLDLADGSRRFDVILDVGGGTPVARLRRALTETGRLVFVGNEHGGDLSAGFGRQLFAFALAPFVRQRFVMLVSEEHHAPMELLAARVDEGRLRPVIDRVIPLAKVPDALADLEAGRVRGKVLVRIEGSA